MYAPSIKKRLMKWVEFLNVLCKSTRIPSLLAFRLLLTDNKGKTLSHSIMFSGPCQQTKFKHLLILLNRKMFTALLVHLS